MTHSLHGGDGAFAFLYATFSAGAVASALVVANKNVVRVDPALHGRILALHTVLLVGTAPIGGPILGWLADAAGACAPIVLGGGVCLLAAGWGLATSRRVARHAAALAYRGQVHRS